MQTLLNMRNIKHHTKIILLLFIVLFATFSNAEDSAVELYRLEVNPQWYTTDNYVMQGPIGISKRVSEFDRERYYIRPSVAYGFNPAWAVRIGLFSAYNNIDTVQNTVEIRPYIGINYLHFFADAFEKLSVSTYFRIEDRIIYDTGDWDHRRNWRARLRFRGVYNFNPSSRPGSWRRMILGAEILRTYYNKDQKVSGLEDNFEVESRLSIGIERTLKHNQKVLFDLSWRYQVPFDEINQARFNAIVVKIRFYPIWGDIFRNRLSQNDEE